MKQLKFFEPLPKLVLGGQKDTNLFNKTTTLNLTNETKLKVPFLILK